MAPVSNNPTLIEGLRYTAGTDKVQNISGSSGRTKTNYDGSTKPEVRNIFVNQKPDSYSHVASFYKYKYNSPASRLSYTGLTFNEIEKPFYNINSDPAKHQSNQSENPNPQNYNIYENAIGYYIISNPKQTKSSSSSKSKNNNPMKKKLEQTYHSGNDNPSGSLVNIVYY